MVHAIIKSLIPAYNSSCMKLSALRQKFTIFIWGKKAEVLQLSNFSLLMISFKIL